MSRLRQRGGSKKKRKKRPFFKILYSFFFGKVEAERQEKNIRWEARKTQIVCREWPHVSDIRFWVSKKWLCLNAVHAGLWLLNMPRIQTILFRHFFTHFCISRNVSTLIHSVSFAASSHLIMVSKMSLMPIPGMTKIKKDIARSSKSCWGLRTQKVGRKD